MCIQLYKHVYTSVNKAVNNGACMYFICISPVHKLINNCTKNYNCCFFMQIIEKLPILNIVKGVVPMVIKLTAYNTKHYITHETVHIMELGICKWNLFTLAFE